MIRSILSAPNEEIAKHLLTQGVIAYEKTMPRLSSWMEENIPENLMHYPIS